MRASRRNLPRSRQTKPWSPIRSAQAARTTTREALERVIRSRCCVAILEEQGSLTLCREETRHAAQTRSGSGPFPLGRRRDPTPPGSRLPLTRPPLCFPLQVVSTRARGSIEQRRIQAVPAVRRRCIAEQNEGIAALRRYGPGYRRQRALQWTLGVEAAVGVERLAEEVVEEVAPSTVIAAGGG